MMRFKIKIYRLLLLLIAFSSNSYANGNAIFDVDLIPDRVFTYAISPDGEWVVYRAGESSIFDRRIELYSIPLRGGTPVKLSLPLNGANTSFSGLVGKVTISPDSKWVVFQDDVDLNFFPELYSVPIDGSSTAQRLNSSITSINPARINTGDVDDFLISPNSQFVVYQNDSEDPNSDDEIFSVPINGGKVVQLTVTPRSFIKDGDFKISPDSRRVVYLVDFFPDDGQLFSIPISGGDGVRLTTSDVEVRGDDDFEITPDSKNIIFIGSRSDDFFVEELFNVSINGLSLPNLINVPLLASDPGSVRSFQISSDNKKIIYSITLNRNDFLLELYGYDLIKKTNTKLSIPLGEDENVNSFRISPNGERILYSIRKSGVNLLYILSNDEHLTSLLITPTSTSNGGIDIGSITFTPDSRNVIFISDHLSDDVFELFSVDVTGNSEEQIQSTFTRLNSILVPEGDVVLFTDQFQRNEIPLMVTEDSKTVFYAADQVTDGVIELFSALISGEGDAVRVNDVLPEGIGVDAFEVSSNGLFLTYIASGNIFGLNINSRVSDEETCFPVKTENEKFTLICF